MTHQKSWNVLETFLSHLKWTKPPNEIFVANAHLGAHISHFFGIVYIKHALLLLVTLPVSSVFLFNATER